MDPTYSSIVYMRTFLKHGAILTKCPFWCHQWFI